MYRLKYRRQARNYLARLPLKTKTAIVNKLHELAANPDNPDLDIEILKGRKGFRLRVGQYRVIYTRQDDQVILEVVKVRLARTVHEAMSRDREDGRATGQPQGLAPEAYLKSTSQGSSSEDARKDDHICGRSRRFVNNAGYVRRHL